MDINDNNNNIINININNSGKNNNTNNNNSIDKNNYNFLINNNNNIQEPLQKNIQLPNNNIEINNSNSNNSIIERPTSNKKKGSSFKTLKRLFKSGDKKQQLEEQQEQQLQSQSLPTSLNTSPNISSSSGNTSLNNSSNNIPPSLTVTDISDSSSIDSFDLSAEEFLGGSIGRSTNKKRTSTLRLSGNFFFKMGNQHPVKGGVKGGSNTISSSSGLGNIKNHKSSSTLNISNTSELNNFFMSTDNSLNNSPTSQSQVNSTNNTPNNQSLNNLSNHINNNSSNNILSNNQNNNNHHHHHHNNNNNNIDQQQLTYNQNLLIFNNIPNLSNITSREYRKTPPPNLMLFLKNSFSQIPNTNSSRNRLSTNLTSSNSLASSNLINSSQNISINSSFNNLQNHHHQLQNQNQPLQPLIRSYSDTNLNIKNENQQHLLQSSLDDTNNNSSINSNNIQIDYDFIYRRFLRSRSEITLPSWEYSLYDGDFVHEIEETISRITHQNNLLHNNNLNISNNSSNNHHLNISNNIPSSSTSTVAASTTTINNKNEDENIIDGIKFNQNGEIESGQLDKIIDILTDIQRVMDTQTLDIFLYTYHYYITPKELLSTLKNRFNNPNEYVKIEKDSSGGKEDQFNNYFCLRIINIIKKWIDQHGHVFITMDELYQDLVNFIDNDVMSFSSRWGIFLKQSIHESSSILRYFSLTNNKGNAKSIKDIVPLDNLVSIAKLLSTSLNLKERKKGIRLVDSSFVGSEAVDWLESTFSISRDESKEILSKLLLNQLILHPSKKIEKDTSNNNNNSNNITTSSTASTATTLKTNNNVNSLNKASATSNSYNYNGASENDSPNSLSPNIQTPNNNSPIQSPNLSYSSPSPYLSSPLEHVQNYQIQHSSSNISFCSSTSSSSSSSSTLIAAASNQNELNENSNNNINNNVIDKDNNNITTTTTTTTSTSTLNNNLSSNKSTLNTSNSSNSKEKRLKFKDKSTSIYHFPYNNDNYPEPKTNYSSFSIQFLDIHPVEVARQLTLIDYQLFKKLSPTDFYRTAWSKSDSKEKVPHMIAFINRSNSVSYWVATEILSSNNIKHRACVLKRFIVVADILRKIRNYNTLTGVLMGLNLGSIQRLKRTWEYVDKKFLDLFQQLNNLINDRMNYSNYRKMTSSPIYPSLPFVAVYLRDLTFIEEIPSILENGFINFEKMRMITKILLEIRKFQTEEYGLKKIDSIENLFKTSVVLTDKDLYKASNMCEQPQRTTSVQNGLKFNGNSNSGNNEKLERKKTFFSLTSSTSTK